MSGAIEVQGLSKVFRTGIGILDMLTGRAPKTVRALDRVDLSVKEGEIFALLGPNGAGKTTFLKILCSLILPNGGRARVGGFDVVEEERAAKAMLSLVIGEERSFYWRLTGRQNLEFFAALYGLSPRETRLRIKGAAEILGIEGLDKRYQEYSTGMKQRLALARSLLNEARILFMDEPTRSLDPAAAARLRKVIKDFARSGAWASTIGPLPAAIGMVGRRASLPVLVPPVRSDKRAETAALEDQIKRRRQVIQDQLREIDKLQERLAAVEEVPKAASGPPTPAQAGPDPCPIQSFDPDPESEDPPSEDRRWRV